MSPTIIQIIDAHHALWKAALPDLNRDDTFGRPVGCIKFWPRVVQTPQLITLMDLYTPTRINVGKRNRVWTILHHYIELWQDSEEAELALLGVIETLEAAIHGVDGDLASVSSGMRLGNLAGFESGTAKFVSAKLNFLTIENQPLYRCIDITTEVFIK